MAFSFSGSSKIITCSLGTIEIDVFDLYSRWKDWVVTSDNSKYPSAFTSVGGDPIDVGNGVYITSYFFLMNGWKIRPQEDNHTLSVINGVLLTSDGSDPFVSTLGSYTVKIRYNQPIRTETVSRSGVSVSDIAGAVLANPSNKLGTDGSGRVTTTHTFPANFSAMSISGDGKVDADISPGDVASAILLNPSNKINVGSSGQVTIDQSFPENFDLLDIDADGQVIAAGVTGGGGSTVEEIVSALLLNPSNKLDTDALGRVVTANTVSIDSNDIANAILVNPSNKLSTDTQGRAAIDKTGISLLNSQVQTIVTQTIQSLLGITLPGNYARGTVGDRLTSLVASPTPPEEEAVINLSPVKENGDLEIVRGDDYDPSEGSASTIRWQSTGWPDVTKSKVFIKISRSGSVLLEKTLLREGNSVTLVLSSEETRGLPSGQSDFAVIAITQTQKQRHLVLGKINVKDSI